ncbi:major facilitator superfamily domain-containing protein [Aspergillus coremiiformis]|uniref:Major facilitator superfamily domain-containing protein n=1 Tax=Aspergillus coremiiformis TaxID=138285 RepID=A0A5N6Z1T5_9EURO|nr:major facilitator superfamily domain-containing protein [Aspergillus coremiiformis]
MEKTQALESPSQSSHTSQEEREEEEKIHNVGILKFSVIFVALCLSVFQVALDEVIIGTALPTITDQFHSLQDIGWYGSAYLFTDCAFQMLYGRLYSMCSVKIVYLVALSIFESGSIICATAPNSIALIFGRLIAGIGAGGILSGVLTIVSLSVPLAQVAVFNGILGAVNGIAFICGPLLSGAIINGTTWRWIFWINPIMSAPTFIIVFFLVRLEPSKTSKLNLKEKISRLDLAAFTLFLVPILCLILALLWGGKQYPWKNVRIVILFILFGLFMSVFMVVQSRKGDDALVPIRILKMRSIAFGMLFSFCTSGTGFILEYYLPIWLQVIKNLSVISSAVKLLPIIAAAVFFTTLSGILTPIIGHYVPFMIIASVLLSVGMGLLSTLKNTSSIRDVLGYQVPAGVGLGCALQQTLVAVQTILPMDDIPIGVSLIILAQTLGGTIALSVADTIFTGSLSSSVISRFPQIDRSAVLNAGNRDIRNLVPAEYLDTIMELYNEAIVHTWYISIGLAVASILGVLGMEWKRVSPVPQK